MRLATTVPTLILLLVTALAVRGVPDPDWRELRRVPLPAAATVLAYSPDAERIAVGHPDGCVTVWNVQTGELVQTLAAHGKTIKSVQFVGRGERLLTIGDDKRARLWSTADWKEVGAIEGVAFSGGVSPDARFLAAQDPEQAIWLWDLSTLKPFKQLTERGKGGTKNITFTADGRYVAAAYGSPWLIEVETKQMASFVSGGEKRTPLKIEQEGDRVSLSLGAMQDDDAPTHRLIPSRVGSLVALGRGWYGQHTFVDVWDMSTLRRLGRYKPKDAGTLTSFAFDNSFLAVEGAEKVTIWKVATGKQVAALKASGIMQFSPRSLELAATDGSSLIIYTPKRSQ